MNLKAQVLHQNVSVKNHSVVYPAWKGEKKKKWFNTPERLEERTAYSKTLEFLIPSYRVSMHAQRERWLKNWKKKRQHKVVPPRYYAKSGFFQQIVQLLYTGDKEHSNVFLATFLTTLRSIRCYNKQGNQMPSLWMC